MAFNSAKSRTQLKQLSRLFLPSSAEFAIYLVIAVGLFALATVFEITNLVNTSDVERNVTGLWPSGAQEFIAKFQELSFLPNIAGIIFWSAVGSLVYILFWGVSNSVVSVRNDVTVIEEFIKPSHADKADSAWYQFAERLSLRASAFLGLIGFTILNLTVLFPLYFGMFFALTNKWTDPKLILNALISLAGLCLVMHLYVVLTRLLVLRVRVFG